MSNIPAWLSDGLCRIATGGGFAGRALYSNDEEVVLEVRRPTILNGIPDLAQRPDLGERSLLIELQAIPEEHRITERELEQNWQAKRSNLFGLLLDGLASGVRNMDKCRQTRLPRLADFAQWATSTEAGLGFVDGIIVNAISSNRTNAILGEIESNDLAHAIASMVESRENQYWDGTATELLNILRSFASDSIRGTRAWPNNPAQLGSELSRISTALRGNGIDISRTRVGNNRERVIRISKR